MQPDLVVSGFGCQVSAQPLASFQANGAAYVKLRLASTANPAELDYKP